MDCKKVREQMMETTGTEESAELRAHTAQCSSCAQEWREMRSLMALLDEWQAPEPSPFFGTRLYARVNDVKENESQSLLPQSWLAWARRPAFGMPLWRPMVAGALALAVAVGLGMYNFDGGRTDNIGKVISAQPKSLAVKDLEALDKNQDLYANIDLLDDISSTADHSKDQL